MPPPINTPSAYAGANFLDAHVNTAAVRVVDSRVIMGLEFMDGPNIGGIFFPTLKPTAAPTMLFTVPLLTPIGLLLRGRCIRRVFVVDRRRVGFRFPERPLALTFRLFFAATDLLLFLLYGFPTGLMVNKYDPGLLLRRLALRRGFALT
jgi:hypothetical protein